ncbi:hypothetical protein [Tichowtungia aerotolerans]|nr:hypothetical protein [Tichowtungia aerotolerans]
MDKKQLSARDICPTLSTPAVEAAGRDARGVAAIAQKGASK